MIEPSEAAIAAAQAAYERWGVPASMDVWPWKVKGMLRAAYAIDMQGPAPAGERCENTGQLVSDDLKGWTCGCGPHRRWAAQQSPGEEPKLMDLLGAAPDLTGGLGSTEFVRRGRDGLEDLIRREVLEEAAHIVETFAEDEPTCCKDSQTRIAALIRRRKHSGVARPGEDAPPDAKGRLDAKVADLPLW